jgi:hypothetical protein
MARSEFLRRVPSAIAGEAHGRLMCHVFMLVKFGAAIASRIPGIG